MKDKELLKNKKPFSIKIFTKKALTTFAIAGFAFASAVGLVACKDTTPEDDNTIQTPPDDNGGNEKPPVVTPPTPDTPNPDKPNPDVPVNPPVEDVLTYEDFMAEYGETANNFALSQIEGLSYYNDSLSTNYTFVANGNKIEQIIVANVVKTGETTRELKIATINIIGGKDVQDIVDGKTDTIITIESETALSFDAQEEYNNSSSTIHTQIEEAIKQNLGENSTQTDEYEMEEFEKPQTQYPQTVTQLVQQYPDKVNEILNEKCFELATKKSYPLGFELEKMHWAKWYIDGDKEITSIQFVLDYYHSSTSANLAATTLTIKTPITIEDFLNKNFSITTAKRDYYIGYNIPIQGTRDELMNSIFEHYGMYKECP